MVPIKVLFIFSVSATYWAKISPSRSQNRLGLFLLVLLQQSGKVRTGHICKNISQVDNNIWRYICKSLQSHRTFLRRFLSTQHHIFIGCLQGMDNIWHYLCLLWQANKCFGISPCFPSSAGSADGHGGESEQVVHLYNYTDLVWSKCWNKCADGTGGMQLLISVHPQDFIAIVSGCQVGCWWWLIVTWLEK